MLRRLTAVQAFVVLLSVIGVSSASAQALDDSNVPGWRFSVTPYFWMAGLKGDVGAYSNLPASSIDVGFGDIFSHLDGPTAFVTGEAWNGRFGVLGDVQYLTIKADASTPGPLFGAATLKQWNFNSTIAGAYRVVDSPAVSVDALVGTRIFHVDNQIDLSGAILPPRSNSIGDTWATAVAGGRLTVPLPHGFLFTSYADVGGFGISSDWTWQIYGGVGYRFKDWLSAYAGYRYLDVRHRNGGFLYDVSEQGPLLSVRFSF
jgi:opacity protein-like surface antigen